MTERPGPAARDRIRFQRPSLPSAARIDGYLELSREAHWFSNGGPCWRLLRERLSDRVGAYCVPVASGTLGLMATMAAVLPGRREPGAPVGALLPSFTFIATAQAALWSGLEPRLIDIDASHWHLDPARLERVLSRRRGDFAVVVAVSTFGTPPPSETRTRWERACRAAGIPLVLDSAAAFGAIADDGLAVGAQGDVEVVSFHATKPFAVGEGGAVFTRDRALCERVELAVNFGLRPDRSVASQMGLNAKMSELHAATALAVLDEFDSILRWRRQAAARIRARAGAGLAWQAECERSTWQFVPVAFAGSEQREQAREASEGRVEVRTYYEPLHEMNSHRHWPIVDGGVVQTSELHERILCLPMANDLNDAELEAIASLVRPGEASLELGARGTRGVPA